MSDSIANASFATSYTGINLPAVLNSATAYMGFTGATGGANSLQTVTNFSYFADPPQQVSLTSSAGTDGIGLNGSATINGGYDGAGNALSATLLGNAQAVAAATPPQTFLFGPGNTPNTITASGQTLTLPQGNYANVSLVGSAVNGNQTNQSFTLHYTNGTSQSYSQSLSDWHTPQGYAGEVTADSMAYELTSTGAQNATATSLYDYTFATNPALTVASISLPSNANVKIVAINVNVPPAVASISPATGPSAGGTPVTLTGSGFTGATAVDFGTSPATSFSVYDDGSITAVAPAGSGTVDVTVVGPAATSLTSPADQFAYITPVSVSSVTVNGDNPALAGVQRSMVDSIVYTFNQAVTLAATNAFTIGVHSGQTGTVPTLTWSAMSADASGASTQWVVTFSGSGVTGGSIGDGVYDLTLDPTKVTSESTPTASVTPRAADTFYRLFGDANGDMRVNNSDYAAFLNTNGLKAGQAGFNAAFDSNGDGRVNNLDYGAFLNDNGIKYSGFTATI
jgi:hypothetical protein